MNQSVFDKCERIMKLFGDTPSGNDVVKHTDFIDIDPTNTSLEEIVRILKGESDD